MTRAATDPADRLAGLLAGALVLAVLVLVVGWPLAATALEALRGDRGANVAGGLIDASAFAREAGLVAGPALETIRLTGLTTAASLLIGVPLAIVLFRTDATGRRFLLAMIALAVFVPMPLHAAGWLGGFGNAGYRQVFGDEPILVGWPGALVVHAAASVPWVVLLVGVGLLSVEPELEESARLDLPGWRVAVVVTLRRSVGAILGAALLVAVLTSGDMSVTDILLVRTYAEEAYVQYGLGRPPAAVALVAIPPTLVLGLLVGLGGSALLRLDPGRLATAADRPSPWRLGPWRWPVGLLAALAIASLLGPPLGAMAWRAGRVGGVAAGEGHAWSFGGLIETLAYAAREIREPLAETATWAAVGATAATLTAWTLAMLARRSGPWRWLAVGGSALLLALPGPVAGMALLLGYRLIGPIYDTSAIVVLGHVERALPFALLVAWPALGRVPRSLLESAAVDGEGPWGRLTRVVLPATSGAIVASWGVAFVLAMGELPVTNLVSPAGMQPLPVFLWAQMHFGIDSRISGVGLVLFGLYAAAGGLAVLAIGSVQRPRRGRRGGGGGGGPPASSIIATVFGKTAAASETRSS